MIRDLLRFLWRRDSESAGCVVIGFAQHMSNRDLRQIADYMTGLAQDREYRASQRRESEHG